MGKFNYIKKLVKYVLYDYKPREIYVRPKICNNSNFANKVVLVTGGSEGIGFEIAKKFSKCGAHVIITGRNEEKLKKAVSDLNNAIYYKNDIADLEKHRDLLDFIYGKFNKIDILVNNAGISNHEKDYISVSEKSFDEQFNINLKGPYFLTQRIIKREKKDLNIIFITSERGSQCDYLPYGLTKIAINSLIEGLSCEYFKNGIRVNGIAPGATCSNIVKVDKESNLASDYYISNRLFIPEEVAEIVSFLADDTSSCISGEIIHTNGGNHLNTWLKK